MPYDPDAIERDIRAQRHLGAFAAVTGTFFLVTFLAVGPARFPGWWAALPPAAGIGALWYAQRQFRQARSRRHGLSVEYQAIQSAKKALARSGYTVVANAPTPHGDVDMTVERSNGPVPVEIKSFGRWDSSRRCRAALEQVTRQQAYLQATRSYIWLPYAQAGLWRRWFGKREGSTRVIFGRSPKRLRRILRRTGA